MLLHISYRMVMMFYAMYSCTFEVNCIVDGYRYSSDLACD